MSKCVQRVVNTVKIVRFHIYTCFDYWVIVNPIRFLISAAMLCTLSCGYRRCTECQTIYFKPMVLPFLSAALIISVA